MTTIDTGTDMLLVEVQDHIARMTFNQPEKHNALSQAIRESLPPTLRCLQDDPDVRVIVITGAGEKAFISGADISEFGDLRTSPAARSAYDDVIDRTNTAWKALEKPIIAMIRGFCIGGGMLTALQADIRIASDDSQFAIPAGRLGLGYGLSGVEPLVQLVGPAWTSEILFSARRLDAAEALHIGLVNRVVTPDALDSTVMELARAIRDNAPLTIAAAKVAIAQTLRDGHDRDKDRLAEMVERCFTSDDYREGQTAFAEKRRPRFGGR
jgi:enoyl-CoA hydratase